MFPILLPHDDIRRRLMERHARVLLLTRRLVLRGDGHPNLFEVHDSSIERRNHRRRREGRPSLQSDPRALTIEVLDVERDVPFADLSLPTAISAGYSTLGELAEDWQRRRPGQLLTTLRVHVYRFQIVEARFLHSRLHRGYTSNPAESAGREEPEALGVVEVDRFAELARERDDLMRRQKHAVMSLPERVRLLQARAAAGDRSASRALFVIWQRLERAGRSGEPHKHLLVVESQLERAEAHRP